MPTSTGHRQIDHTADLAMEIWAPTEEDLLVEAARAVVTILTESAPIEARDAHPVEVRALDRGDRLVRWLNEVLTLATLEGFLIATADLQLEGEGELRATLRGEAEAHDRVRTELKSVTYHDLRLDRTDAGWTARVVIDV